MMLVVDAELNNLAVIRRFIRDSTAAFGLLPTQIDDVELAVDELATNIVRHGYQGQPGRIEIEVTAKADMVEIRLRDQAPPFDPTRLPDADTTLPLEKRPIGGLGVYLSRRLLDTCTHRQTNDGGNELILTKRVNNTSQSTEETTNADHH